MTPPSAPPVDLDAIESRMFGIVERALVAELRAARATIATWQAHEAEMHAPIAAAQADTREACAALVEIAKAAGVEPARGSAFCAETVRLVGERIAGLVAGLDAGCAVAGCLAPATHIEHGAITSIGPRSILTCEGHADLDAVPIAHPPPSDGATRGKP